MDWSILNIRGPDFCHGKRRQRISLAKSIQAQSIQCTMNICGFWRGLVSVACRGMLHILIQDTQLVTTAASVVPDLWNSRVQGAVTGENFVVRMADCSLPTRLPLPLPRRHGLKAEVRSP
jgi:hypothetical protein